MGVVGRRRLPQAAVHAHHIAGRHLENRWRTPYSSLFAHCQVRDVAGGRGKQHILGCSMSPIVRCAGMGQLR